MKKIGVQVYQENRLRGLNLNEAVAQCLEIAGECMQRSVHHMHHKDIMSRAKESEKCITILGGLLEAISAEDDSEAIQNLKDYYKVMIDLVVKMNIKNDYILAQSLHDNFKKIAGSWRALKSPQGTENYTVLQQQSETGLHFSA